MRVYIYIYIVLSTFGERRVYLIDILVVSIMRSIVMNFWLSALRDMLGLI